MVAVLSRLPSVAPVTRSAVLSSPPAISSCHRLYTSPRSIDPPRRLPSTSDIAFPYASRTAPETSVAARTWSSAASASDST
jgi:hypothetical protein